MRAARSILRGMTRLLICIVAVALAPPASAQIPVFPSTPVEETKTPVFGEFKASQGMQTLENKEPLANFRLHLEYRLPAAQSRMSLHLQPKHALELKSSDVTQWHVLDLRYEQLRGRRASFSATVDGAGIADGEVIGGVPADVPDQDKLKLDRDFTAMVHFATKGDGALFSKCRTEKWSPDAKMLGIRGGRLFYDIGWLGVVTGKVRNLSDGKPHTAVLRSERGRATLFVDGKMDSSRENHTRPDMKEHAFHVGLGAKGFDGDLKDGAVENLRFWERALSDEEAAQLSRGGADSINTPVVNWTGAAAIATFPKGIAGVPAKIALTAGGFAEIRHAWVQPLGEADHAGIISRWNEDSLAEGARIYQSLCVTCHGTLTQEGSMPTSRHFQREPFKNGSDPFRQFQTLTQGYGLMMPMPQYTPEQKYAVIHYIRETFVAPHNTGGLFKVDDAYLASLPLAMRTLEKQKPAEDPSRQYEKMNFGPVLNWTFQVAPDNIAGKGVAVRLDPGDGGVSKGRAWAIYDHDTMRVATVTTGSFIDWKGVAFDGSHNSHSSLTGERLFTNPVGPGWANPADGSWEDLRFRGRDGKPYGPLPREWMRYRGMYLHGWHAVQSYLIGDAAVLDAPEVIEYGRHATFLRTLNIGRSSHDLKLRLAPVADGMEVRVSGADAWKPEIEGGFQVLRIPAGATPANLRIAMTKGSDPATLDALAKGGRLPLDLGALTHGGPPRWPQAVTTQGVNDADDGPFATDVITHPESAANPWNSWMRLTGFDFFAGGRRAAVCTWMGDVWIVDGAAEQPLGELKWRRIATGLFQPLGLKIVNETIHVTCRDQIARLHDLNGDGETDFIECFNNDQQVTEHFHEFAMGLQADAQGNFYYAKSARHALPAIVAQHGTLLRVSADGSRTDILASGFRAANGVCLNPDGTFFVTDQEGHWTPKNRINLVHGRGPSEFFGNMSGYHDVTDSSDAAMSQPLCWITNAFDRSPSELLWVPQDAKWGPLNGSLLNLSYGYGKIYTVPFEEVNGTHQGGMAALPMPQFPTGVMRGRFNPRDGQFYGCGMFAWAGNQSQPGGFYRVRYTGKPALQPVGLHFEKGMIRVDFSDALDASSSDASRYAVKAWNLRRSANYGSPHVDEHPLAVVKAGLTGANSVRLTVPELHTTMGIEITCRLKGPGGKDVERVIHGTIHGL
jgi:mono/diheme cytochrome c family protein